MLSIWKSLKFQMISVYRNRLFLWEGLHYTLTGRTALSTLSVYRHLLRNCRKHYKHIGLKITILYTHFKKVLYISSHSRTMDFNICVVCRCSVCMLSNMIPRKLFTVIEVIVSLCVSVQIALFLNLCSHITNMTSY
jgi:hypothetical protein